jgi:phospholipid/cholesterol/gamma-HCH transport system substrate-binding protein
MNKNTGSNWKLGMFIIIGLVLFVVAIYFVGKQQNLFGNTFGLKSRFKTVSGLKVGNNVRFSGINVGTVSGIELVNDSTVVVSLSMEKDVQKYIKNDAKASIGSDGLMGDKVLTISHGTNSNQIVKDNDFIMSVTAIEMEDLMKSVKATLDNAEIITGELAEFSFKMNNGDGALSKLMNDEGFSQKLDATMSNLQSSTKGLSENMEAAKSNFLLKGYFNKKEKAKAKELERIKKEKEAKAKELEKKKKEEEEAAAKEIKK